MKKIGILSLGCARNLVDSEVISGRLKKKGYEFVGLEKADVALVNTCAFIKEAKEESIQTILDLVELKKEGNLKSIIVAGCLSQRYRNDLHRLLPEVDAFLGVMSLNHTQTRFRLTPAHYAYVKISEGCINSCSFCAIPYIKTRFISRQIKSIINEIRGLDSQGCSEINLIGQDITAYGWDLYKEFRLVDLIKQILKNSKKINWIRLLYLSPERINNELLRLIASYQRLVKYVDIPLQHINNRILKRMQRKINTSGIYRLIDNIRAKIPGVAIRTSLIVGFPGETEQEFRQLLDFVQRIRFERLGLFMYSREEGTQAAKFRNQIPQRIKQQRYDLIMSSQQEIARKINRQWQGEILKVLIEERREDGLYLGRSQYDAPEVDGSVFLRTKRQLPIGNFVDVKISDTLEYDLVGEL